VNLAHAESQVHHRRDGNYRFDNVEASGIYIVRPSRRNSFSPAERSFSQIGNSTQAAFTAISGGRVVNPLDTPEYFVRQHYLISWDASLMKAGSTSGAIKILSCGFDTACMERGPINGSGSLLPVDRVSKLEDWLTDSTAPAMAGRHASRSSCRTRQQWLRM